MRFESDEEVWALVRRVERCELPLAEFNHEKHLAVGMAHLMAIGRERGEREMGVLLVRFLGHYQKAGFDAEITRAWFDRLEGFRQGAAALPLHSLCNLVIRNCILRHF